MELGFGLCSALVPTLSYFVVCSVAVAILKVGLHCYIGAYLNALPSFHPGPRCSSKERDSRQNQRVAP